MVRAVSKADGVKHLITMATSEHVIMQNEALVALAIAAAIDKGNGPLNLSNNINNLNDINNN